MKSVYYWLFTFLLFAVVNLHAQQLNYQGIARNANGVALSFQQISLRLTIRDGSATGTNVYSETRSLRTNQFGLFTTVIGSAGATNITGSFATINWITGNKFLQVEIDPDGGSNFIVAGVSQLQSVPFAFFASAAFPVGTAGGDLSGSTYPNPIITNAAITTTKIADTAITTAKIKNAAVTNQKLVNSTVQLNGLPLPLGGGQYFAVGTSGANFNIRSEDSIHTFNIPTASATSRGLLSSASFTTFNNKQDALNGTGFVKAAGTTISYDNTNYTPTTRTINGLDLSANRILTTDNVNQGTTNLYYTDTRARQSISFSGENYLSYNNTTGALTASAVNLSGSNVTGTLAAARMGALTGEVTSTAGSYATTIANNAITTSKIATNQVTLDKLVQIPAGHILMNNTLATGNVQSQSIPDVLTQFSIRNQTTQQASTNFNIAGSGTIGTTLTTQAAVYGFRTITVSGNINTTDHYIKVTTTSITITLPAPNAANTTGRRLVIANRSGGDITITTPSGTFEGYSFTGTLNTNRTLCIFSDGNNWQLESNAN